MNASLIKVVRVEKGRFFSFSAADDLALEYKVNEWTTPKIGKIFIFDSIESARRFCRSVTSPRFFRCEAENVTPAQSIYANFKYASMFWNSGSWPCKPPIGTLYADRVKLLEEVG